MAQQISESDLIVGRWYVGRGRNGNVGYWNGKHFLVIAPKFDDYVIKHEPYYGPEFGCFQPFAVVDEGKMLKPHGKAGWDKHYGTDLELGGDAQPGERSCGLGDQIQGTWKASCFLPDGVRNELTLVLKSDAHFEECCQSGRHESTASTRRSGTWTVDEEAWLLVLTLKDSEDESKRLVYLIRDYTGATLELHWQALASRNLPVLFYRLSEAPQK